MTENIHPCGQNPPTRLEQHCGPQRKAGVICVESSDICSCWYAVKIRLISPKKPHELGAGMLN